MAVNNNNAFNKLYSLALECCRIVDSGGCQTECEQCQFNVYNYVSDIREAALLKASAQVDYNNTKEIHRKVENYKWGSNMVGVAIIVVFCIVFMMVCKTC
jgi:hypothetical protein